MLDVPKDLGRGLSRSTTFRRIFGDIAKGEFSLQL
jgi:hypothetical protein